MDKRIGEVHELQITLPSSFIIEFVRVRVKLDVNKKLARFISFTKAENTEFYQVKFEKLPTSVIGVVSLDVGMRSVAW